MPNAGILLMLVVAVALLHPSAGHDHPQQQQQQHHRPRESAAPGIANPSTADFAAEEGSGGHHNGELVFVHVLYRHGDRMPIDPYPNDPWGNTSFWPTGWGQLTTIGERQHFALGKWLRQRYSHLLGERYNKDNFFIQSTDVDRTLMSALANLAGLYPPSGDQTWNPELPWQPIPVHTVPEAMDHVLAAKRPCAAFEYALKKYKQTAEFVAMQRRFQPLYKYLTESTGRTIHSLTDVLNLNNTLFIETLYNRSLPAWTNSVFPGNGDMAWMAAQSFATKTATPQMARLKTGFLLKDMLQRFTNKTRQHLRPNRSVWVYSAHDTTVASVLNTLGLFEPHSPPYAACVMLELRIHNAVPMVQVFYKNYTGAEQPLPMHIPGCGTSCPLSRMYELYEAVLPGDFEEECRVSMLQMTYEEADMNHAMAGMFLIGSILLLVSLVCFVALGAYGRHTDERWYLRIDSESA